MAIKTILDKIKAQLGADAPAEINSLIADAIREADDMTDGLAAANKESKGRKEKIRELESELESAKDQLSKNDPAQHSQELKRLQEVEGKYNEFLKSQEAELRSKWTEASKIFSIDQTDKRHSVVTSVKSRFKFAPDGSELAIDDVKANLSAYELLQAAKAFDLPTTGSPQPSPKPTDGNPTPQYNSGGQALAARLYSKTK